MTFRLFLSILLTFISIAVYSLPQSELDSLLLLNKSLSGEEKVTNLINISRQYYINSDTTSILYAQQAVALSKQLNFEEGMGKAYLFLALPYDRVENDTALKYYKLSSGILENLNHPWTAFGYENTANIYRERGWYPEALEYLLKALKVYEKSNDTMQIAKVLSSTGYLYYKLGDYQECIAFQKDALQLLADKNSELKSLVYGRIGLTYNDMDIYDSAHFYNKKALKIAQIIDDDFYLSQWFGNIAKTYIKQKKYHEAEECLTSALKHLVSKEEKTNILNNLGSVYLETGRYQSSSKVLDSAINNALKTKQKSQLADAYLLKYSLFNKLNNTEKALDYYLKYSTIQDSMFDAEKTDKIVQMKVRYDTDQKEKALLIKNAESEKLAKEKALAEIAVFNRGLWIIGIAGTSLLIIFILIFISQRNKRKAQAEKDAIIIEEREKGMKAIFNAQEDERKRIAKDLHDGIGQQVSAIKIFFQSLSESFLKEKPELKNDVDKVNEMITNTGSDVRTISHQMMPRALTELGLVAALEDMIDKSFSKSEASCSFEHFNIEDRLPQHVEIGLYRIAQELLNNIMKHSGALKIDVQLMKMQNYCILIVQDDGKGIDQEENSEGIGIMNINNRLRSLNGEMNMQSDTGQGTTATIRIALEQA